MRRLQCVRLSAWLLCSGQPTAAQQMRLRRPLTVGPAHEHVSNVGSEAAGPEQEGCRDKQIRVQCQAMLQCWEGG